MNTQVPVVAPVESPLADASAPERSNILIVDDRLDKRVVFRTILEELDQNIVTASSGEEALRWLLDNDCAVILLDVNMPGMDGLETAELIRSRRKSAHTPIIFITAFADEMHTARGYSLGAVDYILSPVVPNILRSKVKALVQLHRLNAELKKRADERVALAKEQAARTMAEDSQRRASFLAEATQVMASSLDVDTILNGASALVVPFLADYGAMVLVNPDGSVRARRHSCVAGWEHYLGAHRQAFDTLLAREQARAIEEGAHRFADRLTAPPIDGDAADEAPAGEIHAFPLVTRGKARGALLLAMGPSARHLAGHDLSLADNLAGRAASALENCLLYEEIQNADRRKNEFLATLSHELRNPLAPLRSALHMLRTQPLQPERVTPLLQTMDRQIAQMTRLVEDLLDISRITRGAIELRRETLDVSAEIRNALESCQGPLEVGGHQVDLDLPAAPLHIVADRVRIQQILENVILNAVKYTAPGGRIDVGAKAELADVVISVRDNGIGIAPDKLQQVWDLFVQVDESPGAHAQGPRHRPRPGAGPREAPWRHGGGVQRGARQGQHVHAAPAARGAPRPAGCRIGSAGSRAGRRAAGRAARPDRGRQPRRRRDARDDARVARPADLPGARRQRRPHRRPGVQARARVHGHRPARPERPRGRHAHAQGARDDGHVHRRAQRLRHRGGPAQVVLRRLRQPPGEAAGPRRAARDPRRRVARGRLRCYDRPMDRRAASERAPVMRPPTTAFAKGNG